MLCSVLCFILKKKQKEKNIFDRQVSSSMFPLVSLYNSTYLKHRAFRVKSMTHQVKLSSSYFCLLLLSIYLSTGNGYGGLDFDPIDKFIIKGSQSRHEAEEMSSSDSVAAYSPVYVGAQSGLMEADKIDKLPGQPDGVNFDQYAGYVTVDPIAGHALFYYFTEAVEDPASKPLLLWLTGGPGCSSLGRGAMTGPGPFRVNSDGKTLSRNDYAWNQVANIIFLESPVGVGFSYSNTTSDYDQIGDTKTAHESFTFLVNWLERFPEYKTRGFYISGDGYGGHYVPQLAYTILVNNKLSNQTIINLQGIAIGNGWMDDEATLRGMYDFWWMHNLIPYEIHQGITSNCNFSSTAHKSALCLKYLDKAEASRGDIYIFDISTPSCKNSSRPVLSSGGFDTCSYAYTQSYLNLLHVQEALHANITALPYRWTACTSVIENWKDWHPTLLPTIKLLMESDLKLWLYSGDTDARVSVTSTTYFIDKLQLSVNTSWYPWYTNGEVGGYAIGYQKLTFATVRGGGHFIPSYQPARALTIFSSFLEGKLPPNSP